MERTRIAFLLVLHPLPRKSAFLSGGNYFYFYFYFFFGQENVWNSQKTFMIPFFQINYTGRSYMARCWNRVGTEPETSNCRNHHCCSLGKKLVGLREYDGLFPRENLQNFVSKFTLFSGQDLLFQCNVDILKSLFYFNRNSQDTKKGLSKSDGFLPPTEYSEEYKKHPIEMRYSFRPEHKALSKENPMAGDTVYKYSTFFLFCLLLETATKHRTELEELGITMPSRVHVGRIPQHEQELQKEQTRSACNKSHWSQWWLFVKTQLFQWHIWTSFCVSLNCTKIDKFQHNCNAEICRVDYIPHPLEKLYKHRYDTWQKPEGDMEHVTNYIQDYPGESYHFVRSSVNRKNTVSLLSFVIHMVFECGYIRHTTLWILCSFSAKTVQRTPAFKRVETHAPEGKFEGEPTYKCKSACYFWNRQKRKETSLSCMVCLFWNSRKEKVGSERSWRLDSLFVPKCGPDPI